MSSDKHPFVAADEFARGVADEVFGPLTITPNQHGWWLAYWTAMQGRGYVPYYPGGGIFY